MIDKIVKKIFSNSNSNVLIIVFSLLTYFAILHYYGIILSTDNYRFLTTILFFFLIYFYKKSNFKFDLKTKKYSRIFAILLSIILIIGNKVYMVIWSDKVSSIFDLNSIFSAIIAIIGFSIFFYRIMGFILIKQKNVKIYNNNNKIKTKTFILLCLIMILCWLPYFLNFYPGILTNDSYRVIHNTNLHILDDNHCFGYTFFFGLFWKLGMLIFNNMTTATAFYVICQMIILSIIFNFAISYFYSKGLNKNICIILYLIFSLNPLHAYYSITIWRDILFSASFLLLIVCLYEFITTKFKPCLKYYILFIISILMILFFRNNGIYVYLFLFLFLMLFTSNNKRNMRILYISIIFIYFVIKGPVYNYFNIEKGRTSESLSIPLQQIARVVALDQKIDNKTKKELNKYIDVSKIKDSYLPYIADPVKSITNGENLSNETGGFIKVWFNIFTKHPGTYVESYMLSTVGYWYPDCVYWSVGKTRTEGRFENENIYNTSYMPSIVGKLIDMTDSRRIPFIILIWSIGLQFILILFSIFNSLYNKANKELLIYIPIIALWLTIMIAAPVFCELRYVYSLFICAPFLFVLSFNNINKKGVKK